MLAVAERGGSTSYGAASGDAARAAAAAVAERAAGLRVAADGLQRAQADWRGSAADAAVEQRSDLARAARHASDVWGQAAEALRLCAAVLDEADALRRQASAFGDRAAAALAVAGGAGPAAAHAADDAAGFAAAASRCTANADELTLMATRRAVAQLHELAVRLPPTHKPHRRHHHGQLYGLGHGALTTLVQLGEQGLRTSPQRAAMDPMGFLRDERDLAAGLLHSVEHPRKAASQLLGLDQLRHGEYGEWTGALLASAAVPGGRMGKFDSLGARSVTRGTGAGGLVVVRPGLFVPRAFPRLIENLTPKRRRHILHGDETGGGHASGTGKPRKSEFPASWSHDDIIDRVMQTAIAPEHIEVQRDGRFQAFATHSQVKMKVIITPQGHVVSAFPLEGPGVIRNPRGPL